MAIEMAGKSVNKSALLTAQCEFTGLEYKNKLRNRDQSLAKSHIRQPQKYLSKFKLLKMDLIYELIITYKFSTLCWFFSNIILPFKWQLNIYRLDYAWKQYPYLTIWTFFETTAMKSCATMCSLKRITSENGHDITFVMSKLSTFLLRKHPQAKFLPNSVGVLYILKIWSLLILIHLSSTKCEPVAD